MEDIYSRVVSVFYAVEFNHVWHTDTSTRYNHRQSMDITHAFQDGDTQIKCIFQKLGLSSFSWICPRSHAALKPFGKATTESGERPYGGLHQIKR